MKKLNSVIYDKLLLQAEEAKEQGMIKLAEGILEAIGSEPSNNPEEYSYSQLKDDVHKDLWKVATRLMHYYDVESADAEKIDSTISAWASKLMDDLESSINTGGVVVGPLEPKVPGENK